MSFLKRLGSAAAYFVLCNLLSIDASHSQFPSKPATKFENCLLRKNIDASSITLRDRSSTKPTYNALNFQWNKYGEMRTPLAYVLPGNVKEVQSTILCARRLGIPVVARSGGHSDEKLSFGNSDSVIVDFQRQVGVIMDTMNGVVEVPSGVRTGSKLLRSEKYFLIRGLCETVGISYSLGGGYNNFARIYGLLLDNILELDMVDYNGNLLTANQSSNSDLFWALRGAGAGGSFGFVTRYKFKLQEYPDNMVFGRASYPMQMFPEVFDTYQKLASSDPVRNLYLGMDTNNGTIYLEVVGTVVREFDLNSTLANVQHILESAFPTTNTSKISVLSFENFVKESSAFHGIEYGDAANVTDNLPAYYKSKTFFVRGVIGSSEIAIINEVMQATTLSVTTHWQLYGGAIADVGSQETAFVHRQGIIYKVQIIYFAFENRTQAEEDASIQWLNNFYDLTKQVLKHNSSYQNIPDSDMNDSLYRFYGANLKRLMQVKAKYDPENYFQYPKSIPTWT